MKHGLEIGTVLFSTMSRPALGPTQPPIQWVLDALPLGIKRPGREADDSLPYSADVKNAWSYTSTPPIRLHCVVLSLKHRDTFTFTFTRTDILVGRDARHGESSRFL